MSPNFTSAVSSVRAGPELSHNQIAKPQIARPTANYHPNIWGDRFINYEYSDDNITHAQKQVDELKEIVRREVFTNLKAGGDGFAHQLKLIDAIQRLGVAYHFEREIEEALERIHGTTYHDNYDGDLHSVALGFRLLRQHGYNVSSDIFNQFKDANGNFKESLTANVSGMLSLYEATHLRVHGEDILEEALVFITAHLESKITHVRYSLAAQISQALERPLLKCLERLGARNYLSIYQDEVSHNETLLKLAKLDFNLVRSLHKKELSEITRWWKEVDFERKLPFGRDRIVELTPTITLEMIMVDAIFRWDVNCMDELPDYMQIYYQTLLNLFNEVEDEMVKQGNSYRIYHAKEAAKASCRAYFAEARWLHEGCIPSMEEYMHVATTTVGNHLLATISLLGMGDVVTKEVFEWLFSNPKILRASNIMFRLMDDIAGSKFEKERGHVASSIDCYMKQYGVSEEETLDVFNKQVVDLWKDINEELLIKPTAVPRPVLIYTVISLYIDPVPL
ncbi:hypothetical protein L3X38_023531 [Prunus dulcis]|uniref:Uncharacterized protein n=1 Tax=Prunus dulcis TaxID=3755 RepID=A0AAD4Z5B8_PRUDU|nr:hypothetical protein L3X38_023531 [Prunus dulcis]